MSAAASGDRPAVARRPRFNARVALWALAALVVVAIGLDTTYRDPDAPTAAGEAAFDPQRFGEENFEPKVVPALEERAVELTELIPALRDDQEGASEQFGHREGASPYNFSVRGEGVAGRAEGGLMPVKVRGLKNTTVSIQVGPAINGTALRDASGLINFNQFVNQVDYADAATALNNQVKAKVLEGIDPKSLEGKRVSFLGAFTLLDPSVVTITPVQLEVSE